MAASMAMASTVRKTLAYFSSYSAVVINVQKHQPQPQSQQPQQKKCTEPVSRREIVLRSSEIAFIGSIFHFRKYNPEEGRGSKEPVSREEAMQDLLEVIKSTKPDNFTPTIADKRDDCIRVEYESPILGFVHDVEFRFPPGKKSIVQYRSASRLGNFDFDVNRKRIKALRLELGKKGWASEDSV